MIKGQEVWNVHVTKGMEMRTIGNRQVCTFSDMKNNYYEILEETAEKFPDKIGFSDNWNRAYTYGTFIGMVDDFAQWLTEKGLQRGQHHIHAWFANSFWTFDGSERRVSGTSFLAYDVVRKQLYAGGEVKAVT